ncbi:MAG: BTAD domain-containing putative transcriptional regulator [Halanaerobium sp.]
MGKELEIYTLGKFKLVNGKSIITEGTNTNSKCWKIMQYIITHKDRAVSQEELIEELNFWKNSNPKGALTSAVYRLRKRLTDKIGAEAKNYIKTTGTAYTFNTEKDYWLDVEEFEQQCQLTWKSLENNNDQWQESFEQAIELYKGDYLEKSNTEKWVWNKRDRYRELLISTLKKLDYHLSQAERFGELLDYYLKANNILSSDYEFMSQLIEVFLETDKTEMARKKYLETVEFFQNNDLVIPTEITKLGTKFLGKNHRSLEDMLAEIKNRSEEDGAYICSPDAFISIYNLEIRRTRRENLSRYTALLHLTGDLEERVITSLGDKLFKLLSNQLRCSDILCRWNYDHLIILLTKADEKEAGKIIERINNSFNYRYEIPEKLKLETKLSPLLEPSKV